MEEGSGRVSPQAVFEKLGFRHRRWDGLVPRVGVGRVGVRLLTSLRGRVCWIEGIQVMDGFSCENTIGLLSGFPGIRMDKWMKLERPSFKYQTVGAIHFHVSSRESTFRVDQGLRTSSRTGGRVAGCGYRTPWSLGARDLMKNGP